MVKRTTYGIEYIPHPENEQPSGFGWLVALIAIATAVSLGFTLFNRLFDGDEDDDSATVNIVTSEGSAASAMPRTDPEPSVAPSDRTYAAQLVNRPPQVKNLLLRLEEAARRKDVQMEATTIEQLRNEPGAADLDDPLARRLGSLNMRRLFELKTREWVKTVTLRSGETARRIALEHGSTYASLEKLNGGGDAMKAKRTGDSLYVLSRPHFALTVHRRLGFADLTLNGRFFRRYDFLAAGEVKNGAYKWSEVVGKLKLKNGAELEMLLPKNTITTLSEL